MKKLLTLIVICLLTITIMDKKIFEDTWYNEYKKYFSHDSYILVTNIKALKESKYINKDYSTYVKTTNDFYPKNKQDLLNIYYTVLNNGWENFSFYCDKSYSSCLKDIEDLSHDDSTFSLINQLVHPYNSFSTIQSNYKSDGRIDINVEKKYSEKDIENINNKMNNILNELNINNYSSASSKIKVFHDYIANTNKYDSNKVVNKSNYKSDTAYGTLFEGYSICSGYTDALSIFLTNIGVDNVRIANNEHTWNSLIINDEWKHIDLTWDDPVTNTGDNIIIYDYYLISTNDLKKKNEKDHKYDEQIYDFLK